MYKDKIRNQTRNPKIQDTNESHFSSNKQSFWSLNVLLSSTIVFEYIKITKTHLKYLYNFNTSWIIAQLTTSHNQNDCLVDDSMHRNISY